MPERTKATEAPASTAGLAAASHACTTSGKYPRPGGLASVSSSSPRSP